MCINYHQRPVAQTSKHYIVFNAPDGCFELNKVSFGLFQRMINKVLLENLKVVFKSIEEG